MEPEITPVQLPRINIERLPSAYSPDIENKQGINNYDNTPEISKRNQEQPRTSASNTDDVSITTILPTPVVSSTNDDKKSTSIPYSNSPVVGNEDSLIEKEWVDKAKKIISENRSDPYKQEEEVSRLQADYLKKRYGESQDIIK